MNLSWATSGAASADRARRQMAKTGTTMAGQKLWTEKELSRLRELFPVMTYVQMARRVKGRSWMTIRSKCQQLGLSTKRHVWSPSEKSKLRHLYLRGTVAELRAALPDIKPEHLSCIARYYGMRRPRKPFVPTGIAAIDQIRSRAFQLGYSMGDIDKLSRSKKYFEKAMWRSGYLHHRAIARAIKALDGDVNANWRPE